MGEEYLSKKFGTKIIFAKSRKLEKILDDAGAQAAFDPRTNTLVLRKGCTEYEIFHEMKHAEEMSIIGKEKYIEGMLGTPAEKLIRKFQRERYVYNEIMRNKNMFNEAQLQDAQRIIDKVIKDMKDSGLDISNF
ncbi:MAG: zincin-like metallopeptidase toxin domain-containing protein [Flavobacteriales bacterium]